METNSQADFEKEESFNYNGVKALMEIARKSRDPEIAALQSEVSSLREELNEMRELRDHHRTKWEESFLQNATLKSEIKEKTEWLEAYKKSNHLLHEAMISAEMRGVEKGREEMKAENERLKGERDTYYSLYQDYSKEVDLLQRRRRELESRIEETK